jgi:hypothetical protein
MAWKEIVRVPEPVKKRLFIPAEELTMNDWVRFGRERKPERA